jgi:capsule biosynthesis phosphatase
MHKTACIDLDGTLCYTRKENESYSDVLPIPGAIEAVKTLKLNGWRIVIHTARQVKTYGGNIGEINKYTVPVIVEWLDKWGIEYDEIIVGKPLGVYIDDKAIKFDNNWDTIVNDLTNK